ncbi:MAG: sigma-70 family RNA polymerase sigma factor [Kiritimatiellae bacterium]|nr:sigma-70 family RNA polymerase sigma factor [Kiritimatiellia bacterium]
MSALTETIQRVLAGDKAAFSGIVREYYGMLVAFAAFRVPDADVVDEVVQQTFIRVYEQLAQYEPDKDFGAWLRTICRYMVMAELKRRSREQANRSRYREYIAARLLEAPVQERQEAARVDTFQALDRCLQQLQANYRDLVNCRYRQKLATKQIAEKFGRSLEWVTTNLFRVRGMLRECIRQQLQGSEA